MKSSILRSVTIFLLTVFLSVSYTNSSSMDRLWSLSSPDGSLQITIGLQESVPGCAKQQESLYYSVSRGGETVIDRSPLGIKTIEQDFVDQLIFISTKRRVIQEEYKMKLGKRSLRFVEGNELMLRFQNKGGAEVDLILRAHNDGVAFRYQLLGDDIATVTGENTGFAIPVHYTAFMAAYDIFGVAMGGSYEQPYIKVKVGQDTLSTGWAFPALFVDKETSTSLLLTEADLNGDYVGTRLRPRPEGNVYKIGFPLSREGNWVGAIHPTATLPILTPWRVIIIGDLSTLVESTLVDDLSQASVLDDLDWIRPGRSAWSWFSQGTGDLALQKEYVTFAAEMGWEYILIDDGWDQWPDAEIVMPQLVDEAAQKGVGVLLWYNSGGEHTLDQHTPRDRLVDPDIRKVEFDKLKKWGVAGIKVDFFWSDKQDRIQQYIGILRDAAERGLLVNFHGATIPRGWQRTYPNLMTHEAVKGAEFYNINVGGINIPIDPKPIDHVRYAFIRNIVGSMDYTPVVFSKAYKKTGVSFSHQLALSIIFESGLQHFADQADLDSSEGYRSVFNDYPFVRQFMKDVPSTWDDTRLLQGDPETHVVLARRKNEEWFIAGINGQQGREDIAINFDFLEEGNYNVEFIGTGAGGGTTFQQRITQSYSGDTLSFKLEPKDGFVIKVSPVEGVSEI